MKKVFVFLMLLLSNSFAFGENKVVFELGGVTSIPLEEESFDGVFAYSETCVGYKINNNILMLSGHWGPQSIISTTYRYSLEFTPRLNALLQAGIGTDFHPGENAFSELYLIGGMQLQFMIVEKWKLFMYLKANYITNEIYDGGEDSFFVLPLGLSIYF